MYNIPPVTLCGQQSGQAPTMLARFLYTENHSLYEWFKKAYGDE